MRDALTTLAALPPASPSASSSAESSPAPSLFKVEKLAHTPHSGSSMLSAASRESAPVATTPGRFGAAFRAGLERSALGQPREARARRWAHAVTAGAVGVASSLVAGVPAAFERPALGLPGIALGAAFAYVVPALGHAPTAAPRRSENVSSWRRTLLRPEAAVVALRLFANVRHGLLMEPVGVAAHAAAQLALTSWPQAPGSFADVAAQNAAWMLPEAVRFGAMVAAETVYRQLQLSDVAGRNAADAQGANNTVACNSLGASCAQPLYLTAIPGTHLSFSAEQNFFWNNQVQSVEKQFADGIRLFLLEYFVDGGVVHNSHNTVIKFGSLEGGLGRLRALLDAHPQELIVVKLSDQQWDAPYRQQLQHNGMRQAAIEAAGLQPYAIDAEDAAKRSLGALLAQNKRAVFVGDQLPQSDFAARWPGEMHAARAVPGTVAPSLSLLNAFTTYIWPLTSSATNRHLPRLWHDALLAYAEEAAVPNLVAVNDYETSDVVRLARAQNRALAP